MGLVLAHDWTGHWCCQNHLPPEINFHHITRLTHLFFGKIFALKIDHHITIGFPIVGSMCDAPIVEGGVYFQ